MVGTIAGVSQACFVTPFISGMEDAEKTQNMRHSTISLWREFDEIHPNVLQCALLLFNFHSLTLFQCLAGAFLFSINFRWKTKCIMGWMLSV